MALTLAPSPSLLSFSLPQCALFSLTFAHFYTSATHPSLYFYNVMFFLYAWDSGNCKTLDDAPWVVSFNTMIIGLPWYRSCTKRPPIWPCPMGRLSGTDLNCFHMVDATPHSTM
uniref:Uncharacterized protein n=1 Tax=Physcomitrium patens TaxID=3218 RepID=A0A2K1IEE0_PHYPA|nr:hypothetical protein PHYPA_029795 [Physcomitrium patens]